MGVDVAVGVGLAVGAGGAATTKLNTVSPNPASSISVKLPDNAMPDASPAASVAQLNRAPVALTGPIVRPLMPSAFRICPLAVPVTNGAVVGAPRADGASSAVQNWPSSPYGDPVPVQAPATTPIAFVLSMNAEPGPPTSLTAITGASGGPALPFASCTTVAFTPVSPVHPIVPAAELSAP